MQNILFAVLAAVCIEHDNFLKQITEKELCKKWFRAAAPGSPEAHAARHNAELFADNEMVKPIIQPNHIRAILKMLKAGWHLRELIIEAQPLSTIDARAVQLPTECVDLDALLDDMHAMISPLLLEKRITATISSAGKTNVHGNLQHCKQVMLNLLSNAIKYNRNGGHFCFMRAGPARNGQTYRARHRQRPLCRAAGQPVPIV
ncbi:MAG: hypothetical protein M3Y65_10920 [Pseudomonadota bacterium]|nr:hypothetical protein [Pseudomonadota bacterium]